MSDKKPLYQHIATAIIALKNCERSGNTEWNKRWQDALDYYAREHLPSGSGIDNGTVIDIEASDKRKIILWTEFHHMNDMGSYDGWTRHSVIIDPTFDGIGVRIGGRNRNQIKGYLADVYYAALCEVIDEKTIDT